MSSVRFSNFLRFRNGNCQIFQKIIFQMLEKVRNNVRIGTKSVLTRSQTKHSTKERQDPHRCEHLFVAPREPTLHQIRFRERASDDDSSSSVRAIPEFSGVGTTQSWQRQRDFFGKCCTGSICARQALLKEQNVVPELKMTSIENNVLKTTSCSAVRPTTSPNG